ncbi:glycosyltransferase family 9 protein [Algihabitans albus]|uniref:glycosyltransferase family 9 protein n=1 Tax=Algihabitans albus TaxID=2164067 RepID=UPI001F47C6D1|nr:glycosyltransferase family 9 protein [Algihabitans albus]
MIKLSAFGDFILSLPALQAIRSAHPRAEITLLTTAPYLGLAEASGLFDRIWTDRRPSVWRICAWAGLRARLRTAGFERVYDLQRNDRTALYFRLIGRPKPEWVGIVQGASHRYGAMNETRHIAERERDQLAVADVAVPERADLAFLDGDLTSFDLPARFALLVPGCAPKRPEKRWPAERYGALAAVLAERGLRPVLLGTAAEAAALDRVAALCPPALDLRARTSIGQIAALARRAELAVGNDTGPMHVIAAVGCPTLSLFSGASQPVKIAPRGPSTAWLQRPELEALELADVLEALQQVGPGLDHRADL